MATKPQITRERTTSSRKPSRAQIRKRLVAEHRVLEGSLGNVAVEVEFGCRESLHERIQLVEDALARLDNGAYGRCRICGEPIEARRLEVDPATVHCFDCQSATERLRKRAT